MKNNYSVSQVNSMALKDAENFVNTAIGEYEKRISSAVDNILKNPVIDIVLLAGPSSSGKTTSAKKIVQGIEKKGKTAYIISLDDFYFDRDDIPVNSDGLPDYENITALDIPLIKETFNSLINERTALLPVFNFKTGKREKEKRIIHLGQNDVVVVEGIHALNPVITQGIDPEHIYKIYISVSSRFVSDEGKVVMTKRNIRFVRRMIRDYRFRSSTVEFTYFLWDGVSKGEDKFIFPYKNQADEFINSIHAFEVCMFRDEAIELLNHIEKSSCYYSKAQSLKDALMCFTPISRGLLPEDALLREFIG